MSLTSAQDQTLKTDIAANTNTIPAGQPWSGGYAGMQVKDVPNVSSGNAAIAGWYNLTAVPDFFVWRDIDMETVLNSITFANMTPVDAVPTNPDSAIQVWKARSLACQGKQFNLQNLTIGRAVAPMKRANYRAGLQDCLTNIPAGTSGALIAANWVAVRDAAKFTASNVEKLLATGTGTQATPADTNYEEQLTYVDIERVRNLS